MYSLSCMKIGICIEQIKDDIMWSRMGLVGDLSIYLNRNSVSPVWGHSYIQAEIISSLFLNLFYFIFFFARRAWSNTLHNDVGLQANTANGKSNRWIFLQKQIFSRLIIVIKFLTSFYLYTEASIKDCVLLAIWKLMFNRLKTNGRLFYLKTQFVPRSKHFSSRL